MNIPTNFKQLYDYMPNDTFRMLITSPSGTGKTNLLYHILMSPLVYYDQIYLYAKNLEQDKYQLLLSFHVIFSVRLRDCYSLTILFIFKFCYSCCDFVVSSLILVMILWYIAMIVLHQLKI